MPGAHFDITGDNTNIVSVIQDTTKRMEEFASLMGDLGKGGLDLSSSEKSLHSLAVAIRENEKVMKDYEKQIKELQQAQREAALEGDEKSAQWAGDKMKVLSERLQETAIETNKLKAAFNELSGSMDQNEGIMVKLLGGQKNYNEIISNLPGPLRSAVAGLNGMTKAAKAFIATPLGAVLAALILAYKTLTTWLNKSSEGQRQLAKITGYLSGVMAGLQQVVMDVGKALFNAFNNPKEALKSFGEGIKTFVIDRFKAVMSASSKLTEAFGHLFKLEFKEAGASFKDAFDTLVEGSVADKVADTVKGIHEIGQAESKLNADRDKLRRERMEWQAQEGELDKQIAEQRNKLYVGSQAERNKASAKMMDLINQKYNKQIEFAKEEYRIRKESNALTTNSLEDLEAEAALNKQVLELEAQRESSKRMALRVENSSNMSALRTAEQMAQYDEKRKDMFESLNDAAQAAEREGVAVTISAMKEGYEREKAELEHQQKDRLAQLEVQSRERLEKIEELQKAEYKQKHGGSTKGFVLDKNDAMYKLAEEINAQSLDNEMKRREVENADFEKKILESRNESRWEYLQKYGDYKDKELAITEKYDAAIAKTDDEFQKKILGKEKEQALYELQRQYSDAFSYIFADAQSLTDTQLGKAIEYTQQAIKDATEDGNIEALTQLYAQLRNQMSIQADRTRGWGFSGIADAVKLRQKAVADDLLADAMAAINQDGTWTEEIARLRANARQARKDSEAGMRASISEIASVFGQLGDAMESFGDGLDGWGDKIAEIGGLFSGIASQAGNLQTVFSENATSADRWSAGISGVMSIIQMVGTQIAKNKQAQDAWNKSIDAADQKMRMLKLDALDYQQQNIFGVENPYKKAIDGALQYAKAMEDLQKLQSKLAGGQVQTGTRKAIDWGNVGKGAAAGAVAGAALGGGIFSWLTAGLGAAIGGAVGLVAGALSTKVVPVLEDLTSVYGQLWDDQYNLSDELIANYDKLDDATKQIVDNWDEIRDKALEAEKAMEENFSTLAGNLGKDLSSSLADAFRNGELNSAIDSFHDKVTTTIEDIVEQMVFSAIFSDMFDQLQADMKASFGAGGDRNLVDDIMRFDSVWQDGLEEYSEEMQKARDYLKQAGYDVFSSGDEASRSAATKSSLGASQESIDESNGRLTAIQGHTFEINENVRRLAAAAGLVGTGSAPMASAMSTAVTDYSLAIAEVKLAIVSQSQQLADMGLKVADIQGDVVNMLQSTRRIEDNSTISKDSSLRLRSDLEVIVDKGVTVL